MSNPPGIRAVVAGLAALLATGVSPALAARSSGVALVITPPVQTVAPGSTFDVTFQVADSSLAFNAFHMIVAFDPAALTMVKLSPISGQLGPLITTACPNDVHWFHPGV